MKTSRKQLLLLTVMVAVGVIFTWLQNEAIVSWRPTATVHLGMGLVAAGAFLAVIPPLSRNRHRDS